MVPSLEHRNLLYSFWKLGRYVFQGMDGYIDSPVEKCDIQVSGEYAGSAQLIQRFVQYFVADGIDLHNLRFMTEMNELVRHSMRLPKCQLTGSGSNAYNVFHAILQ
jgi:hypothetical protein